MASRHRGMIQQAQWERGKRRESEGNQRGIRGESEGRVLGNWAWSHTRVNDYDEACFMHLTSGVVHSFPKAVGV